MIVVWISGTEGIPSLLVFDKSQHLAMLVELLVSFSLKLENTIKGRMIMDKLDCLYIWGKIKCHKNAEIEGLRLTNLNIETCRTGFEYQNKSPVSIRAVCSLELLENTHEIYKTYIKD